MGRGLIVFSMSISPERQKEIELLQRKRAERGYPKIGDVLIATRTGFTAVCRQKKPYPTIREGHVTKGKGYEVIDNLDLVDGHFHLPSDNRGFLVHLSPAVLRRFFGIDFDEVTTTKEGE